MCCGDNTKMKCEEAYCLELPHTVQCTLQNYVAKGFTPSVYSFQLAVFLIMRISINCVSEKTFWFTSYCIAAFCMKSSH